MRIISFLGAILLLVSCSNTSTDNAFDGTWRMDSKGNGEVIISSYFVLDQKGRELAGYVIINNAVELPIQNVEVSDSLASFTIPWGAKYTLHPGKGQLKVQTSWRGGKPIVSIAHKVREDEIRTGSAIPLPTIEPLPANGLALTPPMGWNSWNHFGIKISDQIIREIADAMHSSGMKGAGYEYIIIDDGWEGGRNEDGTIFPNDNFPDMKSLADYVHGLDLKLGIYSSPGMRTCGGYEGSYGYEKEDALTFASWGIDYLKYDWCGAMRIYGYSRDSMHACYQRMGKALQECGRPIVYSICQYGKEQVWEWGPAAGGNLWRTTDDINHSWERISEIGFSQSDLAPYAGPGHWNDPDMLEVGNGNLTSAENKAHFTLWCMLAAPLIAGNDLRNMSEETVSILTNPDLIAINQDPLGRQAARIGDPGDIEIWTKPLTGDRFAVAVFNRSDKEIEVELNYADLGWENQPAHVLDVWEGEKLSFKVGKVVLSIEGHGVVLLRD